MNENEEKQVVEESPTNEEHKEFVVDTSMIKEEKPSKEKKPKIKSERKIKIKSKKTTKTSFIVGLVFFIIGALFTLLSIIGRWIPVEAESGFATFYKNIDIYMLGNIYDENHELVEGYNIFLIALSYAINIITIAYTARYILKFSSKYIKKRKLIVSLLSSFIKYIAMIVAILCILNVFGVDTGALLAGVGILSLIVGLGAQPLIEDIIAGVFIAFEGVFDVGDIIVVDGFRGVVTEIGVRTTRIEDVGGDVKTINNSDIRTLVNMSSELSIAVCNLSISYDADIQSVEKIIEENFPRIKEEVKQISKGPYYAGVQELGESSVVLRYFAYCKEGDIFSVKRGMNRSLKIICDENNIEIPFNQIVVHEAKEK